MPQSWPPHTHSPLNISLFLSLFVLQGHIYWRSDLHHHLMAPFGSLLMLFSVVYFTSLAQASPAVVVHVQFSTISAAPAVLPGSPLASPPGLSPDIEPLFPTPVSPPPSESSLPIIPSSPSPPNPDNILAPGPQLGAFPPSGALPVSYSVSLTSSGHVNLIFFVGFLYFCLIHLSGM